MALYHKWDVKNNFAYVLQFFLPISDGLGGVFGFDSKNVGQLYLEKIVVLI